MACDAPVIRVRRATGEDAAAIASVLAEAFAPYRRLYTEEAWRATTPDAEGVRARLGEGPCWVAVDGAVAGAPVVGTASVVERAGEHYLRGMAVRPSAGGRGAAGLLMGAVEAHGVGAGVGVLTLCPTPFLERAIRLYERAGFVRDPGPGPDLHGTPLISMTKRLG